MRLVEACVSSFSIYGGSWITVQTNQCLSAAQIFPVCHVQVADEIEAKSYRAAAENQTQFGQQTTRRIVAGWCLPLSDLLGSASSSLFCNEGTPK